LHEHEEKKVEKCLVYKEEERFRTSKKLD